MAGRYHRSSITEQGVPLATRPMLFGQQSMIVVHAAHRDGDVPHVHVHTSIEIVPDDARIECTIWEGDGPEPPTEEMRVVNWSGPIVPGMTVPDNNEP